MTRRIPLTMLVCATFLVAFSTHSALAATVSSNGTVATFTGDAGPDLLTITTVDADTVRFEVTAPATITEDEPECVETGAQTAECDGTAVLVNAGTGDDGVDAGGLVDQAVTVNAGPGDDLVNGGVLTDALNGGSGEDFLTLASPAAPTGASGGDDADGGTGDDLILTGGKDADDIRGATGVDRVGFIAAALLDPASDPEPVDLTFTLDDQPDDGMAGSGVNVHADVEAVTGLLTDLTELGALGGPGSYYFAPPLIEFGEGKVTLRGNDGANTLVGGSGADDIDGGTGNDALLGGDGGDTLRAVDGFADVLRCGPGADTALADTLDVVSDSCESVTRTDVGNANDVPEIPDVPEDLPPTVSFDAPGPGALTTGPTTLAASATDDRGVAAVQFYDDDRIVCTDTAAPYTCAYQPRGEDVGRDTLSVMAIDTAQQTATAFRAFTVPRFALPALSLKVTGRDAKAPFKLRASGKLTLPPQVAPGLGCTGAFVAVQVKAGGRTISNRRVRVKPDCTYESNASFASRKRFGNRDALSVRAIFAGNEVLDTKRSATKSFRIR